MKRTTTVFLSLMLVSLPGVGLAQPWAGILDPSRAIDWSGAGIPGGIPARTTICANWYNGSGAPASTIGNNGDYYFRADVAHASAEYKKTSGTWAATGNEFTYYVSGNISLPSNITLRGAGANLTILDAHGTSGNVIGLGSGTPAFASAISITGGTAAGSTSITVASSSGISVGAYLLITQLNDGTTVNTSGSEGACTWCDGGQASGTRAQGQIVEVTSVSGTTIGITPGLYVAYTRTPTATPFTASAKNAGVENLQVYANNTGYAANFYMGECAYCWLSGVEGNYADGDHVEIDWSYRGIVQNSYFSNAYLHTPGTYDSDLVLRNKSTGMLVQNNIFERLHVSMMMEWGAAGNVIAYNYALGNFDSGSTNVMMSNVNTHGAHPMMNLIEGNVVAQFHPDSIWGSSGTNTAFRNWVTGATKICNPTSGGRSAVSCSGSNGWWAVQAVRLMDIDYLATSYNLVGNVVGSVQAVALTSYNNGTTPLSQVNMVVAVCGPSPCGPNSRSYDAAVYAYALGYGEASDTGSSGYDSLTPYSTLFLHGDYSNTTGAISWASGVTKTLPASFYLSAKPSWWGSVPYPAVGPDVTGGSGPGGHAYAIPAQNCYTTVMGGTDGTGSPLTFNAAACYGAAPAPPVPPTNLSAISQ
jgi:hypothetical protein